MTPLYRVERVQVEGYRAFQREFSMDFPWPEVAGDPDVLVLGSANGVGKTSVLEALLWGGLAVTWGAELPRLARKIGGRKRAGFPRLKSLLRTDAPRRRIEMTFSIPAEVSAQRHTATLTFSDTQLEEVTLQGSPLRSGKDDRLAQHAMENILRPGIDPVRIPGLLYFSSFRRVYEGNIDPKNHPERAQAGLGLHHFKVSALDLTLWKSGVLPESSMEDEDRGRAYPVLNDLLHSFAKVELAGKADLVEGHYQPFVKPAGGGSSYPIDNLSSGQKEIISTLFLLWQFTSRSPAVVLIDEPELYLNTEWHATFLKRLFRLAPENQYVLATHSKAMASAAPSGTLRMLRSAA